MVLIAVYVDDGIVLAEDDETAMKIINALEQTFKITVGEPDYFLGMEIKQDKKMDRYFFMELHTLID